MNGQMPPRVPIEPFDVKAKLAEAKINRENNKIMMALDEAQIKKLEELAR